MSRHGGPRKDPAATDADKAVGGIRPSDRVRALRDVAAGVSAAAINIPQVLGHARIAGAPDVAGMYTVLLLVARTLRTRRRP